MTKITRLTIFLFSLIVIINILISPSAALISDKRLCYDEKCSEPVSLAKTLTKYFSNDKDILSFNANADVKVFSKGAGKRPDLWGVEILGKRGYAPKRLIRETKILQKNLSIEVPTELLEQNVPMEANSQVAEENKANETAKIEAETQVADSNKILEEPTSSSSTEKSKEEPTESVIDSSTKDIEHSVPIPENVSPSYEIIDGTTIPMIQNEPPSDYSSEQVNPAQNEEPILSVHPHPSLVSSTLSFVSKVFDKVAERLSENDKVDSETDNSEATNDIKEEGKDIPKEEEIEPVMLESEVKEESDSVKENENTVTKNEHENKQEIEESKEEPKVVDAEEEKDVLEETEEEEEVDDEEEEEEEEAKSETENYEEKDEKEDERNINEKKISEEKPQDVNSEEFVIESESQNRINSTNDPYNFEIQKNELNSINVQDSTVNDDATSQTNPLPVDIFPEKTTLDTLKVTDQVPSPDVQIEEQVFKPEINITESVTENIIENNNLNAENLVPEAQTLIEEGRNDTSEILEQNDYVNQIQEPETINNTFNASVPLNEILQDVNIVNSDNNIDKENEATSEVFHSSKVDGVIKEDLVIEKNIVSSENDIAFNQNDVSNENDTVSVQKHDSSTLGSLEPHFHEEVESHSGQRILAAEQVSTFNEFPSNRNLLNVDEGSQYDSQESQSEKSSINEFDQINIPDKILSEENINNEEKPLMESLFDKQNLEDSQMLPRSILPPEVCEKDFDCPKENVYQKDDNAIMHAVDMGRNYWEFLVYLITTSVTILIFSLGYYYIENARRDSQLIAKINKLEKELMISTKECILLNDNLSTTKTKLNSIEDESFGSNEMVASLKADLEASQDVKLELEDQVATLEKELESATEAGLALEQMLRELLSTNNEDNPLAQSIEDLQARLNAQQTENEALRNALNLKKQESEGLSSDLIISTKKIEELDIEVRRLEEELKTQGNMKIYMEQSLEDKIQRLEMQLRELTEERSQWRKELKAKELEVHHLLEVVDQDNSNNLDFDKLYNSVQAKAEVLQLAEERDELRVKLTEMESAHQVLEEHVKFAKEEVVSLTEQSRAFEKERKDAETKLEVLSNFFKEKEAQRQKEEAAWLQQQGEVSSTVERMHTMQNEIQNYKQQIEILKREIVDQEREYKSQIGALETKAHEHWVVARQNERRLEELKAESGQLRNRLTLVEKSMNDPDPEVKLHRMETNGESATSPAMFLGADSSSSPIMFSNTSGVPPPPPPSYMFGPPFHPYLPPPPPGGMSPFDVGQRPPPLGGRLSSPPPLPLQQSSGRYENPGSPPPLSPPLPPHYGRHRSPPPPFSNDRIHPPPPPPPSLLPMPPLGPSHNWGEEPLPPLRNSGFQLHQRDQRSRNHKGSLHSSGESLDKTHHSGKV